MTKKEDEKEKDFSTKRVVTLTKNLGNRTLTLPVASKPKGAKVFWLQVKPEAASSFISGSKSRCVGNWVC